MIDKFEYSSWPKEKLIYLQLKSKLKIQPWANLWYTNKVKNIAVNENFMQNGATFYLLKQDVSRTISQAKFAA